MCLITTQKKPLIAEEDIKIYKLLGKDMSPPYWGGKQYKIGQIETTMIKESDEWSCLGVLDSEWLREEYDYKWENHPDLKCFGQGFHATTSEETAQAIYKSMGNNYTMVEGYIPKGSEYYVNKVHLSISSQIVITKKLSWYISVNNNLIKE